MYCLLRSNICTFRHMSGIKVIFAVIVIASKLVGSLKSTPYRPLDRLGRYPAA